MWVGNCVFFAHWIIEEYPETLNLWIFECLTVNLVLFHVFPQIALLTCKACCLITLEVNQCTMQPSIAIGSWNIFESNCLVIAQFWPKSDKNILTGVKPYTFCRKNIFPTNMINIARGTTDPEIESVHLSNLLNNSIYNNKW